MASGDVATTNSCRRAKGDGMLLLTKGCMIGVVAQYGNPGLFLVKKSIWGSPSPPHRLRFIQGCSDLICYTMSPSIMAHLPYREKSIQNYYIHAYFSLWKVIHCL